MDGLGKEFLISFYDAQFRLHGDRPEAVRWSPAGQLERYRLMVEMSPGLPGSRVLDYGCGKGDFLGFLEDRGISVRYTGLDINPTLIEFARAKYPGRDFRVFDVEERDLEEPFDYVYLCGVFNNRVEGVGDSLRNVMGLLFRHARRGLAVNCLSSHARDKAPELNYTDPAGLMDFAVTGLSPHVALRHDRIEGDFTLFVYRSPSTGMGGR
ncbi:MAG: class I SAM-dependent methyltransferase [Thermodesulfovibrionales bacterium]